MGNILETFKVDMRAQEAAASSLINTLNKKADINKKAWDDFAKILEQSEQNKLKKNEIQANTNAAILNNFENSRLYRTLIYKEAKDKNGNPLYTEEQINKKLDEDKQEYLKAAGYKEPDAKSLTDYAMGAVKSIGSFLAEAIQDDGSNQKKEVQDDESGIKPQATNSSNLNENIEAPSQAQQNGGLSPREAFESISEDYEVDKREREQD